MSENRRDKLKLIILPKTLYDEMLKHCLNSLPIEACGLLGGVIEDEKRIVKKVYLLTNVDKSPEHFSMDPLEQFAAVKDMRKNSWILLGNFHSHPTTPARPSEEDKRLAFDRNLSYLILSLMDEKNPVLKSFRIYESHVEEEQIQII